MGTPSEHLKWVVHLPQNGTISFDPQPNECPGFCWGGGSNLVDLRRYQVVCKDVGCSSEVQNYHHTTSFDNVECWCPLGTVKQRVLLSALWLRVCNIKAVQGSISL